MTCRAGFSRQRASSPLAGRYPDAAETAPSRQRRPAHGYLLATKKAGPCKHPGGLFRIRVQLRAGDLAASPVPKHFQPTFEVDSTEALMTKTRAQRLVRVAPALLLLLIPLRLAGQQGPSSNWADDVLKQEGYQTPPKELADAVLAPRYLNVTLTNASPDKKWFLDEIADGPVEMKTFSKPFHELGGVFVDFKANRAASLTVRNNVGIQLISAADGTEDADPDPRRARASRTRRGRPTARRSPSSCTATTRRTSGSPTPATGKSRQLTKTPVLATLVTDLRVHRRRQADRRSCRFRTAARAMPPPPAAPTGPTVKLADTDKNRLRTFPSLMTTAVREAAARSGTRPGSSR